MQDVMETPRTRSLGEAITDELREPKVGHERLPMLVSAITK